jgi:hypothetical protein
MILRFASAPKPSSLVLRYISCTPSAGTLKPIAHPVEARQVGGDLGRGDDVVGLQGVVGVRQVDLPHLGTRVLEPFGHVAHDLAHAGVYALVHELGHQPDAQVPRRRLQIGEVVRDLDVGARRVAGVVAAMACRRSAESRTSRSSAR